MRLAYSFIIPVFNRPQEIKELLTSMTELEFESEFEIVIVEDGSTLTAEEEIQDFRTRLNIRYFQKLNSGPGDSRNYGMRKASGNYFLILDSDVLLPPHYLKEVDAELQREYVHCFGGPDAAHENFSPLQQGINYAMTSLLTTGGIRGGKQRKFQPRSFNMGLSATAFEKSGGFGRIHPGEDPDLVLRLHRLGVQSRLFPKAWVFHKRRINWQSFARQVYKFGLVRPILNKWHPGSSRLSFWFPSAFSAGLLLALLLMLFGESWLIICYLVYFGLLFLDSLVKKGKLKIAAWALSAALVQFLAYGFGFCLSTYYLRILNNDPEKRFPNLFFK